MTSHTVEIVGGGLAGLALGNGLRARGVPVRIVEGGSYPRHRVCGEFLTGLDTLTRKEVGLDEILVEALPASRVAWFEANRPILRHSLPEPALCLSRHRLDHAMAKAFLDRGGHLETGRRVDRQACPGRVLACGRLPHSSSAWVGLKQHFQNLRLDADLELHLGMRAYVGLTRVENSTVNVCGLFPRPCAGGESPIVESVRSAGLASLADRLAEARAVEGTACAVAGLAYRPTVPEPAAIGDRSGLIPPFTGNGMTIALQSAALALDPLESWSRGHCSWEAATGVIRSKMRRRFARRMACARLMHPWLLGGWFRRGLVRTFARHGLVPVRTLYRLCH